MGFQFKPDDLERGIESLAKRADIGLRMYAETAAKKLESHAKISAPWTDRTGAARNRLTGWVEPKLTVMRIWLGHGVDYGKWLELAMNKKYAIVQPTIDLKSGEILRGLEKLLDRI